MMNQEVKDMFNEVILSGRLGKLEHLQLRGDPETDNCMCYFDVASSYYSKTTEEQYTDWIHYKTAPRVESEPVEINEEELNKNEF